VKVRFQAGVYSSGMFMSTQQGALFRWFFKEKNNFPNISFNVYVVHDGKLFFFCGGG